MKLQREAFILPDRAPALAHYPHARGAGDFVFVSGISCRRPDNSYEGVYRSADGTVSLDIREQTRAVLENIATILAAAGLGLEHVVDLTTFWSTCRTMPATTRSTTASSAPPPARRGPPSASENFPTRIS